jgi:predicted nuclease of predicted toxin-antitoxin system
VKILLDENMPESLLRALERLGHEVDSVNHLKLKRGWITGPSIGKSPALTIFVFTRDSGFAHNVRQMRDPSHVKVLRVAIRQQRVEAFVPAFIDAFQKSDWSSYSNGNDWP